MGLIGIGLSVLPSTGDRIHAQEQESRIAAAAEQNRTGSVRSLIKQGVDVNQSQKDGMTGLHWAVYHDNEELAQVLLSADANAKAVTRYGVTTLSLACMNGNEKIVEMLLKAGADPRTTTNGGETPLMTAARTGKIGPVVKLLSHGVNVNAREHKGQTALMWAAAEGHVEVVKALLDAGADYQTPLPSGFTPLFFAVREGRTEVALQLLQRGLDVNAPMQKGGSNSGNAATKRNGPNPLILAIENGHFETALALVQAGADPNAQPAGYAALHALTWVRKPIRGDGNPPPQGSGQLSSLQCVRELVERGADVNVRLERGHSGFADFTTTKATPLILAARTGDMPLVKLLLELGADPKLANADRSTALLAAAGIGDLGSGDEAAGTEEEAMAMIDLLLKLGLDVNAVDANGETAIHGAAYQNWPRLIDLLADRGADVKTWNRPNRWGWTPLLIAQGYRKGNFRPDIATIAAIERLMKAAGVSPTPPGKGVIANQQSWDAKKPAAKPKP